MQAAQHHLTTHHPVFAELIARAPPPPPPGAPCEPYEALVRAIAHQQLHGNAARAILARFHSLFPGDVFPEPAHVVAVSDLDLRTCGFSAMKILAIRSICENAVSGVIPTAAESAALDDEALIARMRGIRGVGRWTIEMMLMTALNRPDILPVDDFGVRDGWRRLNGLAVQPKPKVLAGLGACWSPYRSTAAWYLWRASDEGKKIKQST